MKVAYLAFGANLGDRAATIAEAMRRLAAGGAVVRARSTVYETDAVAPDPQPLYLNAAARIETDLSPDALLALCLNVEAALGRVRPAGGHHAPRSIDIDLLLAGDQIVDDPPRLILPHPRLLQRPFVRIPLAEVALPGLVHPISGERLDRAVPDPSVRRPAGV
ncbi:MAG TPA: 2-amino-4-hydroxy-6-hydroxymethyldihydropteridine diphosphokinase [Polyangia bacterium]|nr:2-amino-4-hydroxy-6-hydroxymethyldihydropteridine diphosphokinase [Polyangia bacterium]